MRSEGRYEIEAANQRLATANEQIASAEKSMQIAKSMMDHAKSQIQHSTKEAAAAKQALKEAEKRWEVIDVDNCGGKSPVKKKGKVSISPGGTADQQGGSGAAVATRNTSLSYHGATNNNTDSATAAGGARISPTNQAQGGALRTGTGRSNVKSVRHIVVTGAGNPSMDGTYTLERNRKRKYGGAPAYRKHERGGAGIEYEYLCLRRGGRWYIGRSRVGQFRIDMYYRTITI